MELYTRQLDNEEKRSNEMHLQIMNENVKLVDKEEHKEVKSRSEGMLEKV